MDLENRLNPSTQNWETYTFESFESEYSYHRGNIGGIVKMEVCMVYFWRDVGGIVLDWLGWKTLTVSSVYLWRSIGGMVLDWLEVKNFVCDFSNTFGAVYVG